MFSNSLSEFFLYSTRKYDSVTIDYKFGLSFYTLLSILQS